MNKQEFADYAAAHLNEYLPEQFADAQLYTTDVLKSNDQTLTGIVMDTNDAAGISPIVYIDDFYADYKAGTDLDATLNNIARSITVELKKVSFAREDVLPFLESYDTAKEHLCIHLCDTAENAKHMQDMPHTELSDFSLTYYVQLPDTFGNGLIGSVAITDELLNSWGVSAETVHQDALAMTGEQKPLLCNIEDMMAAMVFGTSPANLFEQTGGHSEVLPETLFVLTNEQKAFGASMLAHDDILRDAADRLGCSFYVLPSSVHEVLLMPENSSVSVQELCNMVQTINQQQVEPKDQLSDKVQFYERESGVLENAMNREQRLTLEKSASVQQTVRPATKIQYDLYQVRSGEDTRSVCFSGLNALKQFGLEVDRQNYDKVYSGDIEASGKSTAEVLESLFEKFNLQHPADYRSRSMSVSDVVVLHENGRDTAHFCDSIGFVEVPQFLQPAPAVNLETTGLYVDGHEGTWHTIDSTEIQGRTYFLMEHDEFGSSVAQIAVDETGKLAAQDLWHGITPEIAQMIAEEQELNPAKDSTRQGTAIAQTSEADSAQTEPARKNYLKAAEEYTEENYNSVDGRMSTQNKLTPGDDTLSQPEHTDDSPKSAPAKARSSVLDKLHSKQAEVAQKTSAPRAEKRRTSEVSID